MDAQAQACDLCAGKWMEPGMGGKGKKDVTQPRRSDAEARKERLAAQLRANLQKRKAASRVNRGGEGGGGDH
ncbi:MAG: hypothetical protein D6773_12980 [Alphaproteobacteria bacterium]|nr:MAG: hypothetical protein D6773_12980 [Alphaproteobacteria bacterium]